MGRPKIEVKRKTYSTCMHPAEHAAVVEKHNTLTEYVKKTLSADVELQKVIKRIKRGRK